MGGRGRFGIATVLTTVFGGLVAASTGTLLALSLLSSLDATREALTERVNGLLDEAVGLSEAFYKPMEAQARWLAEEIRSGRVSPADDEVFQALLYGAAAEAEQISAISYQRPDGTGFFYDRAADRLHGVEWPPAWRVPLNGRSDGPQTWPPETGEWVLRPSVLDGAPRGTFIAPVRTDEGRDVGVVGVRRNQVPLARAFAENASYRGFEIVRFMLFDDRIVIGHPELASLPETVRPSVDDLEDPFLKVLETAPRQSLVLLGEIEGAESFLIATEAGERVVILRPVTDYTAGGALLVGVHLDPGAGTPELNRIVAQAVLGLGLVVGALLIAVWLGRRAAAPVRRLAQVAELVQADRLDEVEPLRIGSVKELATASRAFNTMVEGLKERRRIRDLFGKYVPEDVAALLVSDDAASRPRSAEATVLFLDIAGFSSLSERLSPARLVETMNAFFSDAVQAIEDCGGMVAQFQGDAVLAVFNVPIARDDHAEAAVRAAQEILETIDRTTYAGERLACRIGINTGVVLAGAIGAKDRLSYTVYGDAVNVAARLESLNKELGTRLLIADVTAERLGGLPCEPKGQVVVRGRSAPVTVFAVASSSSSAGS